MFAKLFNQIFDSTIAEDHVVRHVFMDLLVLADRDGVVDMTPEAIGRRTNVPFELVSRALVKLAEPDTRSRSDLEAGARIVLIDSHRDWGWQIVNYQHYRSVVDDEARRTYFRDRQREVRAKQKSVKDSQRQSHLSKKITQAEAEAEVNIELPNGSSKARSDLKTIASEPVVWSLKLNDGTEYPISSEDVETWARLYPAVEVQQQLRNMSGWLLGNPTKRKTRRGIKRFINTWLSKTQDSGGDNGKSDWSARDLLR